MKSVQEGQEMIFGELLSLCKNLSSGNQMVVPSFFTHTLPQRNAPTSHPFV